MQPGVTPGASIELHAARADSGHGPGVNAPTLLTTWRDTSGNGLSGALTTFAGTLYPAVTNLLLDPNCTSLTYWHYASSTLNGTLAKTLETAGHYSGHAVRYAYTAVAADAAEQAWLGCASSSGVGTVAAGDVLTGTFYIKGTIAGATIKPAIWIMKADGTWYATYEGSAITLTTRYQRVTVTTAAVGVDASQCRIYCHVEGVDNGDSFDLYIDKAMVEKAAAATPWFDGGSQHCAWSGTANASASSHAAGWTNSGWMGAGTAADPYCLVFDGSSDYVTLPDLTGVFEDKQGTLEIWYRSTDPGLYTRPISVHGATAEVALFSVIGDGRVYGYVKDDAATAINISRSGVKCNDGAWHHIVMTLNGTHATLYVDTSANTPTALPAGTMTLTAAKLGTFSVSNFADCSLAVVRVYPTALSAAQVAANYAAGTGWPVEGTGAEQAAVRTLIIAGHNLSALVDWDALDRSSSEHLYASFSIDYPLSSQWDALPVGIVAGAAIEYARDGVTLWEGTVARITRSGPADPVATIEGRGYWAELSDRDDFVKGFVESRYEKFVQANPRTSYLGVLTNSGAIQADTEDQLLLVIPNGTVAKTNQGGYYVLYILDGLGLASANIDYVEMSVGYGGTVDAMACIRLIENPTDVGNALLLNTGAYGTDPDEKIAYDFSAYGGLQAIAVEFLIGANITLTADAWVQIRDMKLYIDRTTAPTIDAAIYEAANDLGIATSSSLTTVGSAVNQLMWDEPSTPESHITETLGRHSAPVICGIGKDRCMTIAPRAGGPFAPYRHFVVSQALQPGMTWDVQLDEEASKDYVRCLYGLIPENDCSTPHPTSATWPTTWYRSSETNCVVAATNDRFRIISNSDEYNPYAEYLGADSLGIPVTAGQLYIARCRSYIGAYVDGTARIAVLWYTDSTYLTDYDTVKDYTAADATEKWQTLYCVPPEGANRARIRIRWTGATSGAGRSLYVRDVEFRPADTEGTTKSVYYPSTPSATNHKVGLVTLDRATETEAEGVAAQAYDLWHEPYSGPVSGLVGTIYTANGQAVPVEEIQPWDWIENLDAPDAARGPHMVTAVHEAGGQVDITLGGDVAFHYEREIVRRRGRYIGAHRVWVKPRYKRVKGKRKLVRKGHWKTIEARYR